MLTLTKTNKPALWVGGGAMTNRAKARFLLVDGKHLPRPLFIKRGGHLSCSLEQALVPIRAGDVIVSYNGSKHDLQAVFHPEAPIPAGLSALRVDSIDGTQLYTHNAIGIALEWFLHGPQDEVQQVYEGIMTYHNRDGGFFVKEGK